MPNRKAKISHRAPSLLAAGLLLLSGLHPALAADKPAPTFLESGSNDLIRFQRGEVPEPDTVQDAAAPPDAGEKPEAWSEADAVPEQKQEKRRGPISSLERLLSGSSPSEEEAPTTAESRDTEPAPSGPAEPSVPSVEARAPESLGDVDAASAASVEPPQAPQALQAPKVAAPAPLDKDIDARLVTVCLNNPGEASGAKAFDIRRVGPPRFVAEIGATACARFEPTRHTLYLWKTDDRGDLALILSSRLDLNDADGTQVSLDWLRDR